MTPKPIVNAPATQAYWGRISVQLGCTFVEIAGDVAQLAELARLSSMNTICAVSVAIEEAPRSEIETLAFLRAIDR